MPEAAEEDSHSGTHSRANPLLRPTCEDQAAAVQRVLGCAREVNVPLDILRGRQGSCNHVKQSQKLGELGHPGAETLQRQQKVARQDRNHRVQPRKGKS